MNQTFQAQIEEILRNIEPALENVFLKKKIVLQKTQVKNCNPDYLWFKFNKSHNPHNHNPHNVASDFKFSKRGCMDYVDLSN